MPVSEIESAEVLVGSLAVPASRWRPESPFAGDVVAFRGPPDAAPSAPPTPRDSPFVNELGDRLAPAEPLAEAVAELLSELHDPEFDLATHDLVHELSSMASPRVVGEMRESSSYEARVERAIDERLAPVARQFEDQLDELGEQLAPLDTQSMTELELDVVLERTAPAPGVLGPTFEFFLKKLWDKTKRAVKGAVKFVKKSVSAVTNLALKPVLAGLRKLIRPLLKKVLAMAMDKLPAQYRPLAEKVAPSSV